MIKRIVKKSRQALRRKGYDIVRHKEIPEWLDLHNIDVVIDIGANDGRYASEIRSSGWIGKIISFEPQPAAFSRLMNNMANDPHWQGYQLGLGNSNSTIPMNSYDLDVLSSFMKMKNTSNTSHTIEVPVKRAEDIFDSILENWSRPFVKIDTQGYEMEVIRGFGDRARDVVGWQIELCVQPLYENQPRLEEVISEMRSIDQLLWRILPGLRDPKTLQAYEFDGIFFRSPATIDATT